MTEISQSQSETLAQRLERGPIAPQAALAILEQLLTSLEPVHAGGAVNGRITPEVIRLEPDGRATFAESEAEVSGGDPRAAGDSGLPDNPGYMAPELISGDFVDARTDVFALGVITYEMLTGTNPFSAGEGAPPGTVVYRIVYRPYPEIAQSAVPGLTADVRSMVATAMARDPGSRFANATSFLEALRPAASSLKGAGLAAGVAVAAGAGAAKSAAQPKGKESKGRSKGKAEPIPAAGAAAAGATVAAGAAAAAGAAGKAAAAGTAAKGTGAPPPPAPGPPGPEEGGFVDSALAWIFEVRRNWAPYFLAGAIVILGLVIVLLVILYRAEDTAATDTSTVAVSTSTSTTARAVLPTDATTTTMLPSTTVTTASRTLTTVTDKLPATVTLSALAATYTGSPVNPAVQTEPDGLIVLLTYS